MKFAYTGIPITTGSPAASADSIDVCVTVELLLV
jgi:hypothetical protein